MNKYLVTVAMTSALKQDSAEELVVELLDTVRAHLLEGETVELVSVVDQQQDPT